MSSLSNYMLPEQLPYVKYQKIIWLYHMIEWLMLLYSFDPYIEEIYHAVSFSRFTCLCHRSLGHSRPSGMATGNRPSMKLNCCHLASTASAFISARNLLWFLFGNSKMVSLVKNTHTRSPISHVGVYHKFRTCNLYSIFVWLAGMWWQWSKLAVGVLWRCHQLKSTL